jgi:hypothetical protein
MTADQNREPQEDLIELEIAAFMGPHIKRARIALVLIGALYIWSAYRAWGGISDAREAMKGISASDPDMGELKRLVDLAYFIVVFTGASGIANIVLAALAGTKTTFAIYTATGIFAVHTAIQLYATEGLIVTSWLWWVTAIVLGLGFQAAYKANQLRRSRVPAEARLVS